jgi:hypothetical protein
MIFLAVAIAMMSYVALDMDAPLLGRGLALAAAIIFSAVLGFAIAETEVQTLHHDDPRGWQ